MPAILSNLERGARGAEGGPASTAVGSGRRGAVRKEEKIKGKETLLIVQERRERVVLCLSPMGSCVKQK